MVNIKSIETINNELESKLSDWVIKNVQPEIERICKKYNLGYVSGMGHYSIADPKGIDFVKDEPKYLQASFDEICEEIKEEPEYFEYTLEHFIFMKECINELVKLCEILDESIMDKMVCWYTYDCNKDCVLKVYPNAYGDVCRAKYKTS